MSIIQQAELEISMFNRPAMSTSVAMIKEFKEVIAERNALQAENEQLKRDNHDLNVALGAEGYSDAEWSNEDDRIASAQAHADAMAVCANFKAKFDDLKSRADAYDELQARIDSGIRVITFKDLQGNISSTYCCDDEEPNATLILDEGVKP